MEHSKTNIIPVYREGQYDHKYMIRVKARAYLKQKTTAFIAKTDLIFTEHKLTYN